MLGLRRLLMLGLYLSDHTYYQLRGDDGRHPPLFYGYLCGHVRPRDHLPPEPLCPVSGCRQRGARITETFFRRLHCEACRTYLYYPQNALPKAGITCKHPRGHRPKPFAAGG
ncbi:hypothetical protein SAMN05216188_105229 [Lentzea xinjiangensis]|uniref:Uncharacterized protein n=1 Tax=Lentzea xinjiangensis TaxID=402600 RepID=A0A1H9J6Q3_9PSEU|nr:hypothetical protein SAMN05216188_105229 [Lentzea xinjiangensis]